MDVKRGFPALHDCEQVVQNTGGLTFVLTKIVHEDGWADLKAERAEFKPELVDLRSERADLRPMLTS